MTHCIFSALLMIIWFLSPGLAHAGEAEAQDLIAIHGNLDDMCAGWSWDDRRKSDDVCATRDSVHKVLEEMGFCLGKKDQSRADQSWHHCTRNSQRDYTPEPSDKDDGTFAVTASGKTVSGVIVGFDCGESPFLIIRDASGKKHVGVCYEEWCEKAAWEKKWCPSSEERTDEVSSHYLGRAVRANLNVQGLMIEEPAESHEGVFADHFVSIEFVGSAGPQADAANHPEREVSIEICPLDTIIFVDPWLGGEFSVHRVGKTQFCKGEGRAPLVDEKKQCRYGQTVLQGQLRRHGDDSQRETVWAIRQVFDEDPCCSWLVHRDPDEVEAFKRPDFVWLEGHDVPRLKDLRFASIEPDDLTSNPEASEIFGNDKIAMRCIVRTDKQFSR